MWHASELCAALENSLARRVACSESSGARELFIGCTSDVRDGIRLIFLVREFRANARISDSCSSCVLQNVCSVNFFLNLTNKVHYSFEESTSYAL